MATVYRREDTGSPTYAFNAGTTHAAHFDALKAVLKACLVSGYGSKPAAGWSLVAEGAQYLVLANATLSGYLCISRPTTTAVYAEIWVARTFAGIVDNRMTGDGLKTGLAVSNSVQHRINIQHFAYSTTTTTWCCVADGKSFVLSMSGSDTAASKVLGGVVANKYSSEIDFARLTLCAGEDSAGNFIVCGGQNITSTAVLNYFNEAGFTSLVDPTTGLLVDTGALTAEVTNTHTTAYADERLATLAEVDLARMPWVTGSYSGRLRGVASPAALSRKSPNALARSLGRATDLYSHDASTPIDLGDGHGYFVAACSFRASTFLITDNPEFW